MRDRMRFCVPCLFGVEGLVAQELREMELEEVQAENGRVLFSGGWEAMVRANLNSRFGERVLLLLGEFPARSFEELFQGVKALPWEELLGREDQFPVTGSSLSSQPFSAAGEKQATGQAQQQGGGVKAPIPLAPEAEDPDNDPFTDIFKIFNKGK